jgi:hypothetical protein
LAVKTRPGQAGTKERFWRSGTLLQYVNAVSLQSSAFSFEPAISSVSQLPDPSRLVKAGKLALKLKTED